MRKFTDIVNENKIVENNDKIVESIDTERAAQLYELASEVSTFLGEKLSAPFTNEEIEFIFGKIKADMDDFLENHLSEETPQGGEGHGGSTLTPVTNDDKTALTLDNVNTVPEAEHVLTAEDIQKINQYYITELKGDEEDNVPDSVIGKTLKEAANSIYPEFDGFADENLMHFITALFGDKYYGEY